MSKLTSLCSRCPRLLPRPPQWSVVRYGSGCLADV